MGEAVEQDNVDLADDRRPLRFSAPAAPRRGAFAALERPRAFVRTPSRQCGSHPVPAAAMLSPHLPTAPRSPSACRSVLASSRETCHLCRPRPAPGIAGWCRHPARRRQQQRQPPLHGSENAAQNQRATGPGGAPPAASPFPLEAAPAGAPAQSPSPCDLVVPWPGHSHARFWGKGAAPSGVGRG